MNIYEIVDWTSPVTWAVVVIAFLAGMGLFAIWYGIDYQNWEGDE